MGLAIKFCAVQKGCAFSKLNQVIGQPQAHHYLFYSFSIALNGLFL
jgi:hypothetical protein